MAKRLQKELKDFQSDAPDWCKAELAGDNMFKWKGSIVGPDGTPYEKGIFSVELDIPEEYPFKPPKIRFTTKIYHPNIKSDGTVCTEVLSDGWSPQLKIQDVLLTLRQILSEPNADGAVEADIAQAFKNDRAAFNKTAKEWTKKHAK
eukprot:TRINITY_DN813_c0_g1_i1.p2 TRINITY_DN813_c0_g1~~TRINITY_DN813_c0_g1_i1.p2  ORF type:complete len:160 (+),score=33.87 TRINITY_DN813_c0_g1_i1:42-482(+)